MLDLAPEGYGLLFFVALNVVNLLVYSVMVLGSILMAVNWRDLRSIATAVLKESLRGITARLRPHAVLANRKLNARDRAVARMVSEARLQRFKQTCRWGVHLLAMTSALTLLVLDYFTLDKYRDTEWTWANLHLHAFVSMSMAFAGFSYFSMLPEAASENAMVMIHFIIVGRFTWSFVASRNVWELLYKDNVVSASRCAAAVLLGTPTSTFLLNAVCTALKLTKLFTFMSKMSVEEQTLMEYVHGLAFGVALHEMAVLMFVCLSCSVVNTWTYEAARARMEAVASSASEETVRSLIAVICDAIVTLSKDMIMSSPCSSFAHFLLRKPPTGGYEGVSFLAFVEETSRERVEEQIASAAMGPGTAVSVSTKLVDGNQSLVKVTLYCVSFVDSDGCPACIIGVLEVKNEGFAGDARPDTLEFAGLEDTLSALRGCGTLPSVSEADRDSAQSVDSAESAVVPLIVDGDANEVAFSIDIGDSTLPVQTMSLAASHMVGPLVAGSSSMLDWIRGKDASDFVELLWLAYSDYSDEQSDKTVSVDLGKVSLQPLHARRAGLEYVGKASIDFTASPLDDASCIPAVLRISQVGMKRLSRKRRRKMCEFAPAARTLRVPRRHSGGDAKIRL
eukprot:TRINITY_DN10466_c1_g1_i8.p1 TRINITY_DN10466_c1_g1~~TRINITY_DN10466_c1_g1_i8.p1  ORF type:complete len:621 (-),score=54.70 TRINITY_DN10466_c1_g1_i8:174-2036(-)